MAALSYVLCLTSVGDDADALQSLADVLTGIDRMLGASDVPSDTAGQIPQMIPCMENEAAVPLSKAWDLAKHPAALDESAGEISGEFVYLYPPGIPMLVPGERVTDEMARALTACRKMGYSLQGMADYGMRTLLVLD